MSPRQQLTPTPYAITAENLDGTLLGSQLTGTLPSGLLSGLYGNAVNLNNAGNSFTGNGAGLANVNALTLGGLGSASFWKTLGNAGTTPGVNFLGTTDNQGLWLEVNSTVGWRLLPSLSSATEPNILGGAAGNTMYDYAKSTVIGGGNSNAVTDSIYYGFLGGGYGNKLIYSGTYADYGVIAGGYGNVAWGAYSAIGGGYMNTNSGRYAAIPGGYLNTAAGTYSFAAGQRAKANHQGTFVWADSQAADFASTTNNQFLIRATNGVGINTASPDAVLDVYGTRAVGSSSDGIVNIGDSAGLHLTLGNYILQAKNGTNNNTTLWLNYYGGTVYIGEGSELAVTGTGVTVSDSLNVSGAATLNAGATVYGGATVNGGTTLNAGATVNGTATVNGNARVTGLVRIGSETNAAPPYYPSTGLVIRRVASLSPGVSNVVARTDTLTLERDGSYGGLLIRWQANPGNCVVNATGVTTAGAQLAFHNAIAGPGTTGTVTVFSNAQNVSHYDISFGNTYDPQHLTHVVLDRYDTDYYIVGTVTSSYNQ